MATHGNSAMAHLEFGGVMDEAVRDCRSPVFPVRPKTLKRPAGP